MGTTTISKAAAWTLCAALIAPAMAAMPRHDPAAQALLAQTGAARAALGRHVGPRQAELTAALRTAVATAAAALERGDTRAAAAALAPLAGFGLALDEFPSLDVQRLLGELARADGRTEQAELHGLRRMGLLNTHLQSAGPRAEYAVPLWSRFELDEWARVKELQLLNLRDAAPAPDGSPLLVGRCRAADGAERDYYFLPRYAAQQP